MFPENPEREAATWPPPKTIALMLLLSAPRSITFRNSSLAWAAGGKALADASVKSVTARQIQSKGESQVRIDIALQQKLAYTINRDQNQLIVRVERPEPEQAEVKEGNINALVSLNVENAELVIKPCLHAKAAQHAYQFCEGQPGTTYFVGIVSTDSRLPGPRDGRPRWRTTDGSVQDLEAMVFTVLDSGSSPE